MNTLFKTQLKQIETPPQFSNLRFSEDDPDGDKMIDFLKNPTKEQKNNNK
jgi:hypothetical protein